jgi:hypothetical protein
MGEALLQNKFDENFQVNMTQLGFKIAFGVNDYTFRTAFDNPDYVKWVVRMNTYEN